MLPPESVMLRAFEETSSSPVDSNTLRNLSNMLDLNLQQDTVFDRISSFELIDVFYTADWGTEPFSARNTGAHECTRGPSIATGAN